MRKQLSLLCAGLLAVAVKAQASGSYRISMPKPRNEAKTTVDRDKYALGQQVFTGQANLTAQSDMAVQKPRLEKCQASLPQSAAKSKSLTALAGKLSDEQLVALEYYLSHRYLMKP